MYANNKDVYEEDMHILIRKSSIYMLIERTISPFINFLVTIYIVRKISVNDYGFYNILLAILGYVALFSSLGLPHIFQRYIPEFYKIRQIERLKRLVEQGLLLRLILIGVILVIALIFSEQLGVLFNFKEIFQYLAIFSIAIVFYLESALLNIALTSVFRHKSYVISQMSYVLFRAGILYFLLQTGRGLMGLLIAESIAYVVLLSMQVLYFRKFLGEYSIGEKVKLPIKRLLRFGGFSYFNEVGAEILNVSTDFLIISAFLGPTAVGIYAFANRVMRLISNIVPQSMFMSVIRPTFFSKFTEDKDLVKLNKMFNFLLKITAFFIFPLITGIIVLGDKLIIYVFDIKYLESLKVLWIVAAFTVLSFFMTSLGLVLQATENVQILFYSKIFAIYNLIANLLVVKPFGIIGIALVTGSAVLFKNLFCYIFARRYISISVDFKSIGKIVLNSFLMGFLVYSARTMIVNIPSFIFISMIGAVIYFIIAHFNRAFSKEETRIINEILPKPVFAF